MKIIAKLYQNNYRQIKSDRKDLYIFEDKETSMVRVYSPVLNFDKKLWSILFSNQKKQSDNWDYYYCLNLKLFEINPDLNIQKGKIIRENFKSLYPYTNQSSLAFYAFQKDNQPRHWVSYTVIK